MVENFFIFKMGQLTQIKKAKQFVFLYFLKKAKRLVLLSLIKLRTVDVSTKSIR